MNQRIRELAEQQGMTGPNYLISSQELADFARLIVKECMAVTVNYPHPVTKLTAAEHIARHFGVRE